MFARKRRIKKKIVFTPDHHAYFVITIVPIPRKESYMIKKIVYALSCVLTFAVGYGMYERYSHTHATESMQLPKPTGALAIGTANFHLIDTHRHERHSKNPNDHRELMIQVWYPASIKSNEEKALYAHPVIVESVIKQLQEPPAHIPAGGSTAPARARCAPCRATAPPRRRGT